jgi:hypothetical protein
MSWRSAFLSTQSATESSKSVFDRPRRRLLRREVDSLLERRRSLVSRSRSWRPSSGFLISASAFPSTAVDDERIRDP